MLKENVIPRDQIEIISKLSSGQFGYVYKGKSNKIRLVWAKTGQAKNGTVHVLILITF